MTKPVTMVFIQTALLCLDDEAVGLMAEGNDMAANDN